MTQHPEEGALHAYIDGELSPAETAALELHVGECAHCAAALAEARGFVAAASRVITTLDAAPSSATKPAAVAGVAAAPSTRVVRPIYRVPYARAAALLLLVGGTAFVVDRTGTFARGKSTQAESVMADAAAGSDLAAVAPAEAAATPTIAPIRAPEPRSVGVAQSTGAGTGSTGSARRESVVPRPTAATTTAPAEFAGRGVAGGVATKDAVPPMTEPSNLASSDAAPEVAKPIVLGAAPPPARMTTTLQERAAASALNLAPVVVRYRTKDGIIVTLTEEPLQTTLAEESLAAQQSAPQPAQRTAVARMVAQPVNSYRWSSAERGKTYTLSGPLAVAELEALSKRLSELERLP